MWKWLKKIGIEKVENKLDVLEEILMKDESEEIQEEKEEKEEIDKFELDHYNYSLGYYIQEHAKYTMERWEHVASSIYTAKIGDFLFEYYDKDYDFYSYVRDYREPYYKFIKIYLDDTFGKVMIFNSEMRKEMYKHPYFHRGAWNDALLQAYQDLKEEVRIYQNIENDDKARRIKEIDEETEMIATHFHNKYEKRDNVETIEN